MVARPPGEAASAKYAMIMATLMTQGVGAGQWRMERAALSRVPPGEWRQRTVASSVLRKGVTRSWKEKK
jgi:hypothetical protein